MVIVQLTGTLGGEEDPWCFPRTKIKKEIIGTIKKLLPGIVQLTGTLGGASRRGVDGPIPRLQIQIQI